MNVNGKYLKDENGDIFSPITSSNTVYNSSGNPIEEESYIKLNITNEDFNHRSEENGGQFDLGIRKVGQYCIISGQLTTSKSFPKNTTKIIAEIPEKYLPLLSEVCIPVVWNNYNVGLAYINNKPGDAAKGKLLFYIPVLNDTELKYVHICDTTYRATSL